MTLKVMKNGKNKKGKFLINSTAVYTTMRFLRKKDREHFYVLHLNSKCQMIGKELISIGSLTSSTVHPREVFKGALLNNSAAIICVHNHPSGDPNPSKDDIAITWKLKNVGDIIGIQVMDHVIIGNEGGYSLMEPCKEEVPQIAEESTESMDVVLKKMAALIQSANKVFDLLHAAAGSHIRTH